MMTIRQTTCAGVLALALLVCAPVFADESAVAGVDWSALSAPQRETLKKFEGQWSQMPPERQAALAKGSERWLSMTPEQRDQSKQRFERWRSLSPELRAQMRERW